MVAQRDPPDPGDDLERLAGALEAIDIGPDVPRLLEERERLVRALRSYLIPRSANPERPLTVVIAGPTGSGKSTLINSLTGLDLSPAGPLRPTTTAPVVLTVARHAAELESLAGVDCEVVVGEAPVLETMVLVDTPDIDSTATGHRLVAEALIDQADVVVFVTSAIRYADAIPWQVLRRAVARGADVIHVLNRVAPAGRGAIANLEARLAELSVGEGVVVIPEHHLAPGAQQVPSLAMRSLRRRLADLGVDRSASAARVHERVLRTTLRQVRELEVEMTAASKRMADLEAEIDLSLATRVARLDLARVGDGLFLPPPPDAGSRARRRWLRAARRDTLSRAEVDGLVGEIDALIHQDLRRWLLDRPGDEASRAVPTEVVIPIVLPIGRLAMEGWLVFVGRIAREESRRRLGLATAVMISAATDSRETVPAELLFGEDAEEIVSRARRELRNRLEVVYEQAGALVLDYLESRVGELDPAGVRLALGALASTPAPADA